MQFIVQKDSIHNGLNAVIKATASRGIQPVLSNVLLETVENNQVRLCATDLDISIEVKIPATITEEGSITLPAKKLGEIISKLPDKPINFALNSETNLTVITCGNSKFDLFGISSSEFPLIMPPEADESIDVEIEPFLNAVKKTVFASANYDSNNVLSGVFCSIKENNLEMAATDGNRLSRVIENIDNKEEKEYSIIIPSRTLVEFSRIVNGVDDKSVSITVKSGQIAFKLQDRYLTSRLLEGQYPKYQQLIPANYQISSIVNRDALISSLDRTATMVNERTCIVRMNFSEDKLQLMADTPELGDSSDEIEVDYKAEELKIAFNYKYVLDALKVMSTDNVKIELGGNLASALFKPDDEEDDYLCLIMPVQVK